MTGSADGVRTNAAILLDIVAFAGTSLPRMRHRRPAHVHATTARAPPRLKMSQRAPFAGRSWEPAFRLRACVVKLFKRRRRRRQDVLFAENGLCGRNVGHACLVHLWAPVGIADMRFWRKRLYICSSAPLPRLSHKRCLLQ